MRPKTSVRQPIIAGVWRRPLSDLLRAWRSQPRKRSPRLFWSLIVLAFVLDGTLTYLALQGADIGAGATAARHIYVPHAANAELWQPLRCWIVHVDGQPRLFESLCRETVQRITGAERFEDNDPLAVMMAWMLNGPAWEEYPFLLCPDAELRALLGCAEPARGRTIEPAALQHTKNFRKLLRGIAAKQAAGEGTPLSPLEQHALELKERLGLFERVCDGLVDGGEAMATATAALKEAFQSGSADLFAAALSDFLDASRRSAPEEGPQTARRLAVEGWLNEYRPFRQALAWNIAAAGLLALSTLAGVQRPRGRRGFGILGVLAGLGCLGWATTGIIGQAILHEGVLIGDGTEALIWCSGVLLALGLLLALRHRDGFVALAAVLSAGVGFLLANHGLPSLSAEWPIGEDGLRLPLLLSAYAALALANGLAVLTLVRMVLAPPTNERLRGLARQCTRPVALAAVLFLLSAFGDFRNGGSLQALGAFFVLPCCVLLLYARRAGWLRPFGVITLLALGPTVTALAWHIAGHLDSLASSLADPVALYLAALGCLSLSAHAALRYYFGKQRIFEV